MVFFQKYSQDMMTWNNSPKESDSSLSDFGKKKTPAITYIASSFRFLKISKVNFFCYKYIERHFIICEKNEKFRSPQKEFKNS